MDNNTLYIIPARGGSKGIPRKNIKPLAGIPLIHYSINVARQLAPDSHILISTDDIEIAQVARQTGLDVPYMRPAHLATDTSGSREVILDAIEAATRMDICFDKVVLLQPTSPLRTVNDVRRCLALYSNDIDMVSNLRATLIIIVLRPTLRPVICRFQKATDNIQGDKTHLLFGNTMVQYM